MLAFLPLKIHIRNKRNETKYGISGSVSGFNFLRWGPNQAVYRQRWRSQDFISHGALLFEGFVLNEHCLLLLNRGFYDAQTGPPLKPDSILNRDKRGRRATFIIQGNAKTAEENGVLTGALSAGFIALLEEERVIKGQYLLFPTIGEAEAFKMGLVYQIASSGWFVS